MVQKVRNTDLSVKAVSNHEVGLVPEQICSYFFTTWIDMRNLTKGKGRWYVPDSNKAGDLEKLREKENSLSV